MAATQNVPFFPYKQLFSSDEVGLTQTIIETCKKGAFIMQAELEDFERNLAEFLDVPHAFGVADGTEALIIALMASGVNPGDEVIVPSHTFVASAAAIHFVGATPVLADCGADHMLDPNSVRTVLTAKTRAIMPVQLNGRTCEMDVLLQIAKEKDLLIVEDSAQALGSKFDGKHAATFGSAGTISFYPAKTLGSFGDGGAVITSDPKVAKRVELLRDHGRSSDGEIVTWGMNSRLDNLQAAILNYKFKEYPKTIERRREIATLYHEKLSQLSQLHLPPRPDQEKHFDIYQNYELEADNRDSLQAFLKENGVGTLIQWGGKAVHQWSGLNFKVSLPNTEKMFKRCLMLPMNQFLTDGEVEYVCDKVIEFYQK